MKIDFTTDYEKWMAIIGHAEVILSYARTHTVQGEIKDESHAARINHRAVRIQKLSAAIDKTGNSYP